jgi:alginate O-acetyltransferase complex protein AlgI
MVFSSITFLLYFLPFFLWVYLMVPKSWKNGVALVFSVVFYAWGAPQFVFILLASTIIDFYLVRHMHRQKSQKAKKAFLTLSILLNVGLLAYFKYANFFVDNLSSLFQELGMSSLAWVEIALPIGISFYTFQTLTYSIDIYRGQDKPLEKVTDYLLYIMLFPQMIAGPIVRFSSIASQLRSRTQTNTQFVQGLYRFSLGLGKKVLIANPMGSLANGIIDGGISDLSSPHAWLGILAYTFQIYFDFSGYSDMAIGLGKIMGFSFPENFNNPYVSKSITEFWRRWHITLGAWMRDYLYIPLGGNKRGVFRNYANLWLVFLVSGLWHGAAWNFVAWGAFHGIFLVFDKLFLLKFLNRIPKLIAISFTFIISMLGWVIFRIEDFNSALDYYSILFTGSWDFSQIAISSQQATVLSFAILFSFITLFKFGSRFEFHSLSESSSIKQNTLKFVTTLCLLAVSLAWLTTSSFNPFIYFRF